MDGIEATYHLRGPAEAAAERAHAIAVEQSVEMPPEAIEDAFVRKRILGRVVAVGTVEPGLQALRIRLSAETVGADAGQLLNMLFGNSSLHDDLTLADIALPEALQRRLGAGPPVGLAGLRARVGAGVVIHFQ